MGNMIKDERLNIVGQVYERRWLAMKFLYRLIATWLIVAPFMVAFFLL